MNTSPTPSPLPSPRGQPQKPSKWPLSSPWFPAPVLACSAPRTPPTPPHCHTHSSARQLASYQGKWKHTLLHTPLLGWGRRGEGGGGGGGGGGGENVPALIGQLTQSYVWNVFIWTQLEIYSNEGWRCEAVRSKDKKREMFCHVRVERL